MIKNVFTNRKKNAILFKKILSKYFFLLFFIRDLKLQVKLSPPPPRYTQNHFYFLFSIHHPLNEYIYIYTQNQNVLNNLH